MRKSIILTVIGVAMMLPAVLYAADEYTTMKDIMLNMASYVTYLEDSLNQEIVHLQADIITSDGVTFTRTLHSGWSYMITSFGDWRVSDLDIIIYKDIDSRWVEIERDEATDNQPTVVVTPSETGTYMIEISVYSFESDYTAAHYGLVVSHEMPE